MVRPANAKSRQFYANVALWATVTYWLVKNDLGSIAFVATCLLALWTFGLREKFDGEENMSAYSVFNRGGRAIMGGFTGEQFDQQMRGGVATGYKTSASRNNVGDAPLVSTADQKPPKELDEKDKLKRRSAAAAAAERRMQQQQMQEQS